MRLGFFVLLAAAASAQNQSASAEKEAVLGASLARDVRQQNTILESAAIRSYLDGISGRLAAQLPASEVPFTFAVSANLRDPDAHEPLVLPGGYVFMLGGSLPECP
jgi:predicted Zn-dependent protease